MQKREIFWVTFLAALIGFYIYLHLPTKREIQIVTTIRPGPRRTGTPSLSLYVTLDNYYKLNSIVVTPLDEPTNAVHHEMWHLVATNGSEPVKIFQYGETVQGMKPYLKGVKPEPLIPGDRYQMVVTAGKLKGTSKPFTTP
jgi:hypothetical protein